MSVSLPPTESIQVGTDSVYSPVGQQAKPALPAPASRQAVLAGQHLPLILHLVRSAGQGSAMRANPPNEGARSTRSSAAGKARSARHVAVQDKIMTQNTSMLQV